MELIQRRPSTSVRRPTTRRAPSRARKRAAKNKGYWSKKKGAARLGNRDALRVDVHGSNRPEGARDGIREHPEGREHPRGGKAAGDALEGDGDPGHDEELRPGERGAEHVRDRPDPGGLHQSYCQLEADEQGKETNALSNTGSSCSARSKARPAVVRGALCGCGSCIVEVSATPSPDLSTPRLEVCCQVPVYGGRANTREDRRGASRDHCIFPATYYADITEAQRERGARSGGGRHRGSRLDPPNPGRTCQQTKWIVLSIVIVLVPISIGISISRYRLWDIDSLINKALVYGLLTGLLGALYIGLIIGLES